MFFEPGFHDEPTHAVSDHNKRPFSESTGFSHSHDKIPRTLGVRLAPVIGEFANTVAGGQIEIAAIHRFAVDVESLI